MSQLSSPEVLFHKLARFLPRSSHRFWFGRAEGLQLAVWLGARRVSSGNRRASGRFL